jgi:hypothetical protein
MQHDVAKIEDTVLALLGAFGFDNGRVRMRSDFDVPRLPDVQRPSSRPDRTGPATADRPTAHGRYGATPFAAIVGH